MLLLNDKNKAIAAAGLLALILCVVVVICINCNVVSTPSGNKSLDWKEQTIVKLCKTQGEEIRYIEGVPTCYNTSEKTYLAYSSVLEAMVSYCKRKGCPCPEDVFQNGSLRGTPEVLWGNRNVCFVLFYGNGCPHCAREIKILNKLYDKYNITIVKYEVYFHPENAKLWQEMSKRRNVVAQGVPTTFIENYTFVGVLGDDEIKEISRMLKILPSLNVSTTTNQ